MAGLGDDRGEPQKAAENRKGRKYPCPVVAIGASAGGLEAFEAFFRAMPPDSGMAFVLVQHLSPRHETLMPELVAQHTEMPVRQVDGETLVEVNQVYVIPPDATLTIDDCVLYVSRPARRGRRSPIDSFFRSLAEDQGDDAVGIILSGTGTDGALGLKAIKEHGGLTLVQDPRTARYDSMPRSALLTGMVDHVLPVEEMAARLVGHRTGLYELRGGKGPEGLREEIADHLGKICSILRRTAGHDFRQYKQSTLVRRVRRRIDELRAESAAAYIEQLARDPREADQLFHDLLIGVTHFFRDAEAFEVLETRIVPRIFEGKDADSQVRVWVPGCSTGEEAYSIAMLLREQMDRLESPPQVLVFATDIDSQSLEAARQAMYPESTAGQVSPERLERFFTKQGNLYQVTREVRELCLFSTHNLIADPPFSRLDLVSCRNLLIYLESSLQKKVISLYHYALRPGGYLFLGPSENVTGRPELFRTLDKKHRIFQSKDTVVRPPVSFPLTERVRFGLRQPEEPPRGTPSRERNVARAFETVLLESYAPACVVVNEGGSIVYFSPRTGRYLEAPAGVPSLNVLDMARKGLRLDLRTALHKAVTTHMLVVHEDVVFEADGETQRIHLIVRPLPEVGEEAALFMVVFQEVAASREASEGAEPAVPRSVPGDDLMVRRLEAELKSTRDHLHATLEELESSNEELVSSNEELLSMNEELQSANEELQTSKEELQSVNEELETVNAELKKKLDEIDRFNSDLQNLFQSTQIATVFVDRDLRIKKFTPAAMEVFRLIEADLGRPITDVVPRFEDGELVDEIRRVLRSLAPWERQVRVPETSSWYMLRILPYRTIEDVIDGVVVTLIDVTDLKRAQEQRAQLAAIVESSHDAIVGKTLDGVITSWNAAAERIYGYSAWEAIGRSIDFLVPPERSGELSGVFAKLGQGEAVVPFEIVRLRKDGTPLDIFLTLSPVRDTEGRIVGVSGIDRDISDRKRAQEVLQASEARLRRLVESNVIGVIFSNAEGAILEANDAFLKMVGFTREDLAAGRLRWIDMTPPEYRSLDEQGVAEAIARGACAPYEKEYVRSDGSRVPILIGYALLEDGGGSFVCFIVDLTFQKRLEEELRQRTEQLVEADQRKDEFLAMLGHELRNPLAPIRNCLHLLELPNTTPGQADRARATIERQVLHLTRLVDDLLDISRISRGKILIRRERTDLAEVVRATVDDQRSGLESNGLELTFDLPDRPLWVNGDPTRLSQAVGNVLHNAGKFTDPGGRIVVSVREEPERGTAVVCTEDTGIGMEPELLPRIFEPFSQADRGPDRSRGGLGLGLALVRALIEMHGGEVEAMSEGPGRGSEIRVRLPLEEDGEAAAPEPQAALRRSVCPRRCLLIEDNVDAAESMGLLLELAGHQVAVAHEGTRGLEIARQQKPDVVVCDIGLPGELDGYGVARAFRADPDLASACLIALTGYGQEEDRRRALGAGFDAHLTKPADPEALKRLVEDCQRSFPEGENGTRSAKS
jgi:two-component system CheB/CheR fusion protein